MALTLSVSLVAAALIVDGPIESERGGFVFPDGSVQATAAGSVTPIAASGVWTSAGLVISPRMILHDLVFNVDSDTSPPCDFAMSYVLDQINSRTFRRFSLGTSGSVELHYEAGIDTANLRFGTIGGGACVRHWVAMGFPVD